MQKNSKAIVLHTIKYNDTSIIADLFTEEMGKASFAVKMSQSRKAQVKRSFFQPLSIVNIDYDGRSSSQLQHIRSVQFAYSYSSLPFHPVKDAVAIFLAEFLSRVLRNEGVNEPLFKFIESSLMWFDCSDSGIANFHLVFIMRLTRFLGIYPNVEDYSAGCVFDLRNSIFTNELPLHTDIVKGGEARLISLFLRMNYENMHAFQLSRTERNRCLEICLRYYRIHIADMPELKSVDVLKELFD